MPDTEDMIESTLVFRFDEAAYEAASEYPTFYRALDRKPRVAHPFHVYDDIMRQPRLVGAALEAAAEIVPPMAQEIAARGLRRIIFTGIGASYHVGASAVHAMWRLAGLPAEFVESSEALFSGAVFDYEGSVVIGLSASGNTAETVEHLRAAREAGAYTLAFVNLDHTRLTGVAHQTFVAPGGYGLVWDYTTRLAVLYLLAVELGLALNQPDRDFEGVRSELNEVPLLMERTLAAIDDRCRALGGDVLSLRAAVVPAAGNQLPTAWEMALRFEEMAHYPARGRPLIDFLHGGVGYLARDIVTILLAPAGETYELAHRAAQVTQLAKSPCIAVLDEDDRGGIGPLVDGVLRVPAVRPVLKPLLYVLPAQLIPYYAEVARPGGNPETQRSDRPPIARAFDVAMPPKSH